MQKEIYQVIVDEDRLKEFIEWLPDHGDHEQYYCTLFSRKKYCPTDPACHYDKTQLKRFTATKERLFHKIRQLECPVGAYRGHGDTPVPQESLALYMSLNPRDLKKCIIKGVKALIDCVESEKYINPHQEILTVIQNTKSETRFHVFDIDTKDEAVLTKAKEIVGGHCSIIETRGGYHFLVPQKVIPDHILEFQKNWYQELKKISDVTGDALTPVVGCYQGGFSPKLHQK